ncbi:COX5A-domain-containing protein [Microthyrium microscopicum]|uniref:Cytochrome c oxidase subunit 6, mitochondrial n=1 Tax=Microthyrium microscopicum TaxID=703497 RepID=A0A6A6UR59_9PEZI|nr:COX5A-domain-containing protein [Microthyrium microscopicum]
MSSLHILRAAARCSFRPAARFTPASRLLVQRTQVKTFSAVAPLRSAAHENESFEEFSERYENEFNAVNDVFELQRNLNNAFAYDLVPSPSVITAALRAARRVNDFPTAVRIFEGVKFKVENPQQYEEYLRELEPIRQELGISLKEWMYPDHA